MVAVEEEMSCKKVGNVQEGEIPGEICPGEMSGSPMQTSTCFRGKRREFEMDRKLREKEEDMRYGERKGKNGKKEKYNTY